LHPIFLIQVDYNVALLLRLMEEGEGEDGDGGRVALAFIL